MARTGKTKLMEMIRCSQVHYRYCSGSSAIEVLRGVDLIVEQGSHVAIVGPSGAGKSTLLRLCAALDWPEQGTVAVGNCASTAQLKGAALARFRREQVGLIFQQFSLLPTLTALENAMLPLLPYQPRPLLRKRAASLLAEVGLAARAGHYPGQLSGGEQQRVAIARALIAAPPVLLADEPTGSLDAQSAMQVMALLDALCREHSCALVIVTHDSKVAKLADRQLCLNDGLLVDI